MGSCTYLLSMVENPYIGFEKPFSELPTCPPGLTFQQDMECYESQRAVVDLNARVGDVSSDRVTFEIPEYTLPASTNGSP